MPHLCNLLFNIGAVLRPKRAFSLAAFRMQLLFTPRWLDNKDGLSFERPLLVGRGDGGGSRAHKLGIVAFLLWSTNSASWAGWGRGPRSPGQRLQSATKATLHLPHLLNFPILHNNRLRGRLSLRDEASALCLSIVITSWSTLVRA